MYHYNLICTTQKPQWDATWMPRVTRIRTTWKPFTSKWFDFELQERPRFFVGHLFILLSNKNCGFYYNQSIKLGALQSHIMSLKSFQWQRMCQLRITLFVQESILFWFLVIIYVVVYPKYNSTLTNNNNPRKTKYWYHSVTLFSNIELLTVLSVKALKKQN